MIKKLPFILSVVLFSLYATAQQAPFLQWQKTYGGKSTERGNSVEQTADSGYIVLGNAYSKSNGDDYWVLKLNANGNIDWQKTYGGSKPEYSASIKQTKDGGYVAAGSAFSNNGDVTGNHGGEDYWVLKLNANGNIDWQKTYGGTGYDACQSIQQTNDGGYIIAGFSASNNGDVTGNHGGYDYWVAKLKSNGDIDWQKTYGGSNDDLAYSIQQTTDDGFVVAGTTKSNDGDVTNNHGGDDFWVLKLKTNGDIEWQKTYGGIDNEVAYTIMQTKDGGYIVSGDGFRVFKLDMDGEIEWKKTDFKNNYDVANTIKQTSDNNYILCGTVYSDAVTILPGTHGYYDYCILKLNTNGEILWQKFLGGSHTDVAHDISQTSDGGYISTGYTYSHDDNVSVNHGSYDLWVVKLSPETLDNNIVTNVTNDPPHCDTSNYVAFKILNTATTYTVRLYRFGELYDSAFNVANKVSFHGLPPGAYYATATNPGGEISFSSKVDITAVPKNPNTTSITSTQAALNWSSIDCADNYRIQFHKQGNTEWNEKNTDQNAIAFDLKNLKPGTAYIWRVASRRLKNGIYSTGKYSDSVTFTTTNAFAFNQSKQNSINLNNKILFKVLPNPAKGYFIIHFDGDETNKVNVMLYDVNGKVVWSSGLINSNSFNGKRVNTTQFAKGIYYLKVINENGELIGSTKIVIAN